LVEDFEGRVGEHVEEFVGDLFQVTLSRTTGRSPLEAVYSSYSQLPSGGRLLHPQPEDMTCRDDRENGLIIDMAYFMRNSNRQANVSEENES
jgi:hypothetical protein